ncbi:protein of unknown function [Ruminococcaceae bacterium BL-6]|nr:protein of unknown function [Ruminococcaceae bacterium BL-6]
MIKGRMNTLCRKFSKSAKFITVQFSLRHRRLCLRLRHEVIYNMLRSGMFQCSLRRRKLCFRLRREVIYNTLRSGMFQCSLRRRKLCFRLRREVIITHPCEKIHIFPQSDNPSPRFPGFLQKFLTADACYDIIIFAPVHGGVSEWFKELVLKTSDPARDQEFESLPLRHFLNDFSPLLRMDAVKGLPAKGAGR